MPRLGERPVLRVIDGGNVRGRTAEQSSSTPSHSPEPGATTPTSTVVSHPSSQCVPQTAMTPTGECRVLVCGSRTWNDPEPIRYFLAGLKAEHPNTELCILHGSWGAGRYGGIAAEMLKVSAEEYGPRLGEAVGALKTADIVLICSDEVILRGEARVLLKEARYTGLTTYVISHDSD